MWRPANSGFPDLFLRVWSPFGQVPSNANEITGVPIHAFRGKSPEGDYLAKLRARVDRWCSPPGIA